MKSLREVLAENLQKVMARTPDADTGPKLEAKSGVGQSTVSRIINRQTAVNLDKLEAIAKALGVQPWELLLDSKESREEALRRVFRDSGP